jgi:hypothetical protein
VARALPQKLPGPGPEARLAGPGSQKQKQARWSIAFTLTAGRLEFELFEPAGSTLPAALKEKT